MKLLLILFVLSFNICKSQEQYDSLQKFSYLIWGSKNDSTPYKGTGFFIRYNYNCYFITANHVITGYNSIKKYRPINFPVKQSIEFKEGEYLSYLIDSITEIKELKDFSFHNQPDLSIIKIDKYFVEHSKINSVEIFVGNYDTLKNNDIDKIIIFGYSMEFPHTLDSLLKVKPIFHEAKIFSDYRSPVLFTADNLFDSINYAANIITENRTEGASGSPVFFKLKNRKIIFGGLFFADITGYLSLFVRPEIILKKIFEYDH